MKCFYHEDHDAVAICKSCMRGLCHECGKETSDGLACPGKCEERARKLAALIDENIRSAPIQATYAKNLRNNGWFGSAFYLAIGLIFMGLGVIESETFPTILGGIFTAYGLFCTYRTLTFPKIPRDEKSS